MRIPPEHDRSARPLEPRWLVQTIHLTCPATQWKYVVGATTRADADLVMLDLEDSIPRGDDVALALGRENVVRAVGELDWGRRLRFFRPRGRALDPGFDDVRWIVERAGQRLDGLVYPKVDGPEDVEALARALDEAEAHAGLPLGHVRVGVLVESVLAEERAFEIARASSRIVSLIFGSLDYWSSLGLALEPYDKRHPLLDGARARVVKAAASIGVPAIAEMTLEYPTRDKSPEEQRAALDACWDDARHARRLGFAGKWIGIPAQAPPVREAFAPSRADVERAIEEVRAFAAAEREGRGAVMIGGRMADRASDRAHRVLLAKARAAGLVPEEVAAELGLGAGS